VIPNRHAGPYGIDSREHVDDPVVISVNVWDVRPVGGRRIVGIIRSPIRASAAGLPLSPTPANMSEATTPL
jgi:hypothetical protein